MKHKLWQIVINFAEGPGSSPGGSEEFGAADRDKILAALETVVPPPWNCRFGSPDRGEPLVSALFVGIKGNTSLDAQIRADNLVKQCLAVLGDLPLVLESCGVRQDSEPTPPSGD